MRWSGVRVLVTGASGFLGTHLAAALRAAGAVVTATSRSARAPAEVAWVQADLTDPAQARRALADAAPAIVFHLSSLADGHLDPGLIGATFAAETVATVNLLDAARAHGVGRVILAASFEMPDPGQAPTSPYAAAKAASHVYGQLFHAVYGLPVTQARIFMAYGPGQPDAKLIPTITRDFLAGVAPRLASPQRSLDWIYIDDVIEGLLALAGAPGVEGRTVDIGSGVLTTIADLAAHIGRLCGAKVVAQVAAEAARGAERVAMADVAATRALIGWQPRVALDAGLSRWLDHCRERAGHNDIPAANIGIRYP
ncbi:MAG: NAD-dependent epimerase/dehydratase family protein [Burkholderiales bacterium]|nr:NAD-dependent epimerase/dehydratase family protein [Burkholderiales bacterium]